MPSITDDSLPYVILPTSDVPFYRLITALDGVDYQFEFQFNQRTSLWQFSIYSKEGTLLAPTISVVCRMSLLRRYRHVAGVPTGELVAIPYGDDDYPPGLDELGSGKRVELSYFSATT